MMNDGGGLWKSEESGQRARSYLDLPASRGIHVYTKTDIYHSCVAAPVEERLNYPASFVLCGM
jgi:hypothetical protein